MVCGPAAALAGMVSLMRWRKQKIIGGGYTLTAKLARANRARGFAAGSNILVAYRSGDAVGQAVAEYYCTVRDVPAANRIAVATAWTPETASASTAQALAITQRIDTVIKAMHPIVAILLCGHWPTQVSGTAVTFDSWLRFPHYMAAGGTSVPDPLWNDACEYHDAALDTHWPNYYKIIAGVDGGGVSEELHAPFGGVPPVDRYANLSAHAGDWGRVGYAVCRLQPPALGNPTAEIDFCKGIVDDAIAAEDAEYQTIDGSAVVRGATYGGADLNPANRYFLHEVALNTPESVDNILLYGFTAADGDEEVHAPYWGDVAETASGFGFTSFCPGAPGWGEFGGMTGVFWHMVANDDYYGARRPAAMLPLMSHEYLPGAVNLSQMSYGNVPAAHVAIPWEGPATWTTSAESDAKGADRNIAATNQYGHSTAPIYVRYTGADATATAQVSGGSLILRQNGATVATISLGATPQAAWTAMGLELPANWERGTISGQTESRAMRALAIGCAVSVGCVTEPQYGGMPWAAHWYDSLINGLQLWQQLFKLNATEYSVANTVFGDPLYAPFRHRRAEAREPYAAAA